MKKKNPAFPPWPQFSDDEIEAVARVLKSGRVNYWTGDEVKEFEREFADFAGAEHSIALANGSVALELALHALGIGAGDEVVVTPRTFIASASSIVICGAKPVFADVDPDSQNITSESISKVITSSTKAVIAVHLAGWPCDMEPILNLAKEKNIRIIEDCAQAHGAMYKGRPVGSFGDAAAFSFCHEKIMTTGGEGGMLLTNDRNIWVKAWAFKDHGRKHGIALKQKNDYKFQWIHDSIGTNWRMAEMQAVIGRIQLGKLNEWIKTRRHYAKILTDHFKEIPGLRVTEPPEDFYHSYYKYYVFVHPERLKQGWDRNRIISEINAEGVPCFSGICPEVYLEKAFTDSYERLPEAKRLGETSLMFQVHPTLTEENIHNMCKVVDSVMRKSVEI